MSLDFHADITETPIQKIVHPTLTMHNVALYIKRDDLTHPLISGNKWRKLKYNLAYANKYHIKQLISFSGAFSNHLYALAGASRLFGFATKVFVRGPELDLKNPCLKFAKACGIELVPLSRIAYRQRYDAKFLAQIRHAHPDALVIPEGGSNQLALKGIIELAQSLPPVDQVWCATGSGGTLAGLIEGLPHTTKIKGVAVLKQADYLKDTIKQLSVKAQRQHNWQLITDKHYGGYAQFDRPLWQFCQEFKHQLPLEPIYTGKLLRAIFDELEQGQFCAGTQLLAIHTGGLQGLSGLKYRALI